MFARDKFAKFLDISSQVSTNLDRIYYCLVMDLMYIDFFENVGIPERLIKKKVSKLKSKGIEVEFNPILRKFELKKNAPLPLSIIPKKKVGDNKYIVSFSGILEGELITNQQLELGKQVTLPIILEYKNNKLIGRTVEY